MTDENKKSRVTAADVAKRAGVSRWTVARCFLDEGPVSDTTKEKVKKIVKEMGYTPNLMARSLIRKESGMIAIVIDNFMNYYMHKLLRELSKQLQCENLLPILINIEDIANIKTIKQAEQFQIDGIIFLGSFFNDYLLKLSKINHRVPLIVIGRDIEQPEVRIVSIDNYEAGKSVASLLLDQQYRSFGYIGGSTEDSAKAKRFNGFNDRLNACGHTIKLNLQVNKYDSIEAYLLMSSFLKKSRFSLDVEAIFCETDTIAIGVIDALKEQHLDKKVAIVGFDNIQLGASVSYQLTTYDQDVVRLAKEAIKMIYHYEHNIYIQGEIQLRGSHLRHRDQH